MSVDDQGQMEDWVGEHEEELADSFINQVHYWVDDWLATLTRRDFEELMAKHESPYQARKWGYINSGYRNGKGAETSCKLFADHCRGQYEQAHEGAYD